MQPPLRTPDPTVPPSAESSRRRGSDGRFLPRARVSAEAIGEAEGSTEEVPAVTEPDPEIDESLPEDRFLNRELSWLDFNARVLALAEDPETPLLERAKFLAIFASNLDEFYMVRVAGLKRRLKAGLPMRGGDRLVAAQPAGDDHRAGRRPGHPARRLLRRGGPAEAGRRGHRAGQLGRAGRRRTGSGCARTSGSRSSRC